jgi:glycerophosphoryl diester phosphodiesterase
MKAWFYPRVIAHRGGGALAPENTLAALDVAFRCGCRAVEVDARLSADGTPFLIHDATLDRTTNGTGRVAETRDAVLRAVDAGRRFGAPFAGEPLPTLREAMMRCLALGLSANVEIKAEPGQEEACGQAVARIARRTWEGPPPLLSSFSPVALAAAREAAPELPRALLVGRLPRDWRERATRLGCVAIHGAAGRVSAAGIAAVRRAGLAVACYTVNDPAVAQRLLAAGVAAVFTDRPDLLKDL